jgi:hypothetical protein
MKYKERDRLVAELRELADFIEERGLMLPNTYHSPEINLYLTDTDYVRNAETDSYESVLNEPKTKQNLKRTLDALGSCEKEYTDERIAIEKKFECSGRVMIRATVDRSLACKRVVVGQKLEQAKFVPAKLVDEVEWQCDEGLSLRALVSDL